MNRLSESRQQPALVVAVLALVAAVAGTAVAADPVATSSVNKKQTKKIAKKQATKQINALAPGLSVASAANAENAEIAVNAQNAQNADTVGGVGAATVDYGAASNSPTQTIFSGAGLTLRATCAGGATISVTATTTKNSSSIHTSVVDTDISDNNKNDDVEDGLFGTGINFDLLAGNDGNPGLITFEYNALDGSSVTGTIAVDEVVESPNCRANGHVLFG